MKNKAIRGILFILGILFATLSKPALLVCHSEYSKEDKKPERKFYSQENKEVDFDTRLHFYLDMKTQNFFRKLVTREKLLLQMIQNIAAEVKARGKSGIADGDVGFDLIYEPDEQTKMIEILVTSYSREINALVNIINELEKLQKTVRRTENKQLIEDVTNLKNRLSLVLKDQRFFRGQFSEEQIAELVAKYSDELDMVLRLYEQLDAFEKKARAVGDQEILAEIENQKRRIIQVLEERGTASPISDKIVENYIKEAEKIVQILKELDKLESGVTADSQTVVMEIESVKNSILNRLDARIFELLGYQKTSEEIETQTAQVNVFRPTVSDFFKEWKAKRMTDYQVKFTQYNILRTRLINTATDAERTRMLERELTDALLNYADNDYELADLQFEEILKGYGDYYANLDGVIFYKSETNYARKFYDAAMEGYQQIVNEYPKSSHRGEALYRLMVICYTYGWFNQVHKYFTLLKSSTDTLSPDDLNKIYYLMGYVYFKENRYEDARKVLTKVSKDSKYYLHAQYLLGVVYANLENYARAENIFEELVKVENYPWTDISSVNLRNEALLKLGFIYYQRGEYDRAIAQFEAVSRGYKNYDKSLIGQAWASLKKGDYDKSIERVRLLCSDYFASNYTYEALILAAHCKRIQKRPQESLKDLRYITRAKNVLTLSQKYNQERRRILEQAKELARIEEMILERQDRRLYPDIVKIRETINRALLAFSNQGYTGTRLLEEYNDERRIIAGQLEEFDEIIKWAQKQGRENLVKDAAKQRARLLYVLETYQGDKSISNVNYFLDYPLAAKEGGIIYQREILKTALSEMEAEKLRIERALKRTTELINQWTPEGESGMSTELEILEDDLRDLKNRLNRFQIWLATHQVEEIKTDADQWADFSGFGMSDITFTAFREKERQIDSYSRNLTSIEDILKKKKSILEEKIARFDEEVRKIQQEMESEKIRLEKLEKEKYFKEIYFEKKTRELEKETQDEDYIDKILENKPNTP